MIKLLLLLFPILLFSQSISEISGTIENNESLTISGSAFGSGPIIIKWDNFESYEADYEIADESDWRIYQGSGSTVGAWVDDGQSYSGNLSLHNSVTGSTRAFNTSTLTFDGTDSIYVSHRIRYDISGYDDAQIKLSRVSNFTDNDPYGGGGTIAFEDNFAISGNPGSRWYRYDYHNGNDWYSSYIALSPSFAINDWSKLEFYIQNSSSAGAQDGKIKVWCDNNLSSNRSSLVNMASGYSFDYDCFWAGLCVANLSTSVTYNIYIDDLYISKGEARVEIGNSSVYTSCTHREIQIPTAWSSTSITVTVNQGTFAAEETAYLFVVDADGDVSSGYEIEIGGTAAGGGSSASQKKTDISSVTEDSN